MKIINNVFSNARKIAYSLVESSGVQVCVDNPVESSLVLGEMLDITCGGLTGGGW